MEQELESASMTSEGPQQNRLVVEVVAGLSKEIDGVAARATPSRRFLTSSWFRAAIEAYGGGPAKTLVGRRADHQACIAMPIVSAGPRLLPATTVPGCFWPFRSFPIAENATPNEVVQFLRSRAVRSTLGWAVRLGPVYADDPVAVLLRSAAAKSGWCMINRRIGTDFLLDLDAVRSAGSWPRPSTLKKNRYYERQLANVGDVEWRFVVGCGWSAEVVALLDKIEAKSWVGHSTDRSAAKFVSQNHRRFWEAILRDSALAKQLSATILLVSGEPIAFSFGLDSGSTRYVIANSFDPAFSKHSPGKVVSYRDLATAVERGVRYVDWGSGDSGYKQTVGADPCSEIDDYILIRGRGAGALLALPAGALWRRSGHQ